MPDKVVIIKGKLNFKEGEVPKLLADSVVDMDEAIEDTEDGAIVKVRIPAEVDEAETLELIHKLFRRNHGGATGLMYLQNGKIVRTDPRAGIEPSEGLKSQLGAIVGNSNVKIER